MQVVPDKAMTLMKKVLDCSAARQRTIAHNIANIDTPGFKRSDVSFVGEFRKALESGTLDDIQKIQPQEYMTDITATRNDGNNVDIDLEMGIQAKNSLLFKTFSTLLRGRYKKIQSVLAMRP